MATTLKQKHDCFFALYCTVDDIINSPMFQPTYQELATQCAGDERALKRAAIWSARAMFSLEIGSLAEEVLPTVRAGTVYEYDENEGSRCYVALILADKRYSPKLAAKYPNWLELRVLPDDETIAKIKAAMPVEALRTCQPKWFSQGSSIGGPDPRY